MCLIRVVAAETGGLTSPAQHVDDAALRLHVRFDSGQGRDFGGAQPRTPTLFGWPCTSGAEQLWVSTSSTAPYDSAASIIRGACTTVSLGAPGYG